MHHLIERAYSMLPVWQQNLAISAYGALYRSQRLGPEFDGCCAAFRERDGWTADRLRGYLQEEVRTVLLNAIRNVPYYQRTLKAAGLDAASIPAFTLDDLRRLPITPKEDLREHGNEFLAEGAHKQRLYHNPSSGSTGTPISSVWSARVRQRLIAAREVRSFGWAGTSTRYPRATLGGRMVVVRANDRGPFYRYNAAERQVYMSAYHLKPENAASYVEGLNRYRPRVFTGYAHGYYFLARHMLDRGLQLDYRPDALILTSEPASAQMKSVLNKAFGARAFEEYSAVENCLLATECEHGSLHVSPDFGIVEIVDEKGEPAAPGQPGAVLCTGLLNDVQVLIRYRVGDIAVWSPSSCACGRNQLPVLQSVEGRLEDVVVGSDGRLMVRFHSLFLNLPRIVEGQVIQEALDRIRVRVVAQDGFGVEEEREIRSRTQQRLGPVDVVVERVGQIPRNARGKFRAVVSLLSTEERASAGFSARAAKG